LAMIGWIIETVFFSILSSVSYIYSYGWTQLLPYLSIVTIKVASIAYFTRKGVREAFGW